ncbi:MAG: hypothetical protein K6F05_03870 [Succinivibrio sp.]|nr:hypothetical protein [Succinivibrio sp.]
MFSLRALTLESIIESTYKKGEELTPELITKLADPEVSTYDITYMLCTYINEQKKIANGKDLQELCNLKARNEDLRLSYQSLNSKYNDSLRQVLESKKKEIELTLKYNDIEKENAELKRRLDIQRKSLIACGVRV